MVQAVSDFRSLYLDWYELSTKTLQEDVKGLSESFRDFEGVALAGMGGSGIACDIAYSLLRKASKKPVTVVKDFTLPNWVRNEWVLIAVSYSGNTAETLSVVKEAINRGLMFGAVTSGGRLKEIAEKAGAPYLLIEGGRAPRASFPALTLGLLKLLATLKIWEGGIEDLRASAEVLRGVEEAERIAEDLSDHVEGTIPVFITDEEHYPLALRGREEVNENAKTPSIVQVYPESAHNDIVSWEGWFGPLSGVVLDTGNEVVRYVGTYLLSEGVPTKVVDLRPYGNYISKALKWAQIIGLASVRLAVRRGIDPSRTEAISKYKKFLKEYLKIT